MNWAQATELVSKPLHHNTTLLGGLAEEFALLVMLVDEVVENGTGLPDAEAFAVVRNETGTRPLGLILRNLAPLTPFFGIVAKVERNYVVRNSEVLHEHSGLEGVGARAEMRVEGVLGGHFEMNWMEKVLVWSKQGMPV